MHIPIEVMLQTQTASAHLGFLEHTPTHSDPSILHKQFLFPRRSYLPRLEQLHISLGICGAFYFEHHWNMCLLSNRIITFLSAKVCASIPRLVLQEIKSGTRKDSTCIISRQHVPKVELWKLREGQHDGGGGGGCLMAVKKWEVWT